MAFDTLEPLPMVMQQCSNRNGQCRKLGGWTMVGRRQSKAAAARRYSVPFSAIVVKCEVLVKARAQPQHKVQCTWELEVLPQLTLSVSIVAVLVTALLQQQQ